MFRVKFVRNSAITLILSILMCACNSAANNSQNTETQYPVFSYTKVGHALGGSYSVNNLFVSGGNVYLSLADSDEGTFGYAKISKNAAYSDDYQTVYLTTPKDQQYSLIGDMVVNQQNSILYVPVAYMNGSNYIYTWLKYKPDTNISYDYVGSYQLESSLHSQFALKSASFSDGVLYANYAGNLIGFSEDGSKELFKENQLLLSWQDSFSIEENNMIAINNNDNGLVKIRLDNKERSELGENFVALANKGFEAMPKFTIYNHTIYILAIHRIGAEQAPHLALCSIRDNTSANNTWSCKVAANAMSTGNRLINLDVDKQTGKIYFISENLTNGTQLYVIN